MSFILLASSDGKQIMSQPAKSRKEPTLKDLAREASLSAATISRSLDPFKKHLVNEKTRSQIQRAAKKIGYTHNIPARRYIRRKTECISLIFSSMIRSEDFEAISHFYDTQWIDQEEFSIFNRTSATFQMEFMQGIAREVRRWGYDLRLELTSVASSIGDMVTYCGPPHSDGVIVYGQYCMKEVHDALSKKQVPMLLLSPHEVDDYTVPSICCDSASGMKDAVAHLSHTGRRNIAYITVSSRYDSAGCKYRYFAFREHMTQKDLWNPDNTFILKTEPELVAWIDGYSEHFPFDAVMCHNDDIAYCLITELGRRGVRVPDDVAVIGYDNNPVYCRLEHFGGMSTVAIPRIEMGLQAARIMIEIIEKKRSFTGQQRLPSTFIPRQTS